MAKSGIMSRRRVTANGVQDAACISRQLSYEANRRFLINHAVAVQRTCWVFSKAMSASCLTGASSLFMSARYQHSPDQSLPIQEHDNPLHCGVTIIVLPS